MKFSKSVILLKKAAFLCTMLYLSQDVFAQNNDTTKNILHVRGGASITNNGFSFIPSFSLGRPAAIFNFNITGGKRFSFEPEFRFALEDARPWSFIFIWRYKIIDQKKIQFTAGTHFPAVPFRVLAYQNTPSVKNTLATSRVIPIEFTPNVVFNKHFSMSLFYLYAKGISDDAVDNTNFVNLRAVVSNIKLSKTLFLRVNPQFFYLQLDDKDGFYVASNIAISSPKTPFSIGSTLTKPLKTEITGKKFDWNINLTYNFSKTYIQK